ncbi:UvrB/UvrC motif-containing protein [Candidatus Pacearchaeota archaeon]|nr:UvrB/UvrC motif-containing protein [Candidatus Pacearchaeota archaeon]
MGELRGAEIGKNLEKVIFDLKENEEGWTSPEALEMHHEYPHFLFLDQPVSKEYDEKYEKTLYVIRIGPGKNDFYVDFNKSKDYIWKRIFLEEDDFEDALYEPSIAVIEYEKPKTLKDQIDEAEENQDYELAAKLKDKIKKESQ